MPNYHNGSIVLKNNIQIGGTFSLKLSLLLEIGSSLTLLNNLDGGVTGSLTLRNDIDGVGKLSGTLSIINRLLGYSCVTYGDFYFDEGHGI